MTDETHRTAASPATFTNGLSPAEAERLAWLLEELGEAQQAIGKALRHGYESCWPRDNPSATNRRALEREVGDVLAAFQMMWEGGDLDVGACAIRQQEKRQRVREWMHQQPAGLFL